MGEKCEHANHNTSAILTAFQDGEMFVSARCSKCGKEWAGKIKPRPEVEKPKHPCPECAVCEMWSRTAGCCRDESEEFGECPYKHEEEVKP